MPNDTTTTPKPCDPVEKAIREEYLARGLDLSAFDYADIDRRITQGVEDFTPEENEAIMAAFDRLIEEAEQA